jgi:hypothetical protein
MMHRRWQTTVHRTHIMAGSARSKSARSYAIGSFQNQLTDHLHKRWMSSGGRSTNHVQSDLARNSLCLDVQIVDHFHVIGNETDWRNDHV